jgi:hypothetical protein
MAEQLIQPPLRTWTRTDFAALRAFVQRVPLPTIARLCDSTTAPGRRRPRRPPHSKSTGITNLNNRPVRRGGGRRFGIVSAGLDDPACPSNIRYE